MRLTTSLERIVGDRLPIAMRALEASTGKTAAELFKMMEMGQLGAEYIMPFVQQLEKLTDVNNAYAKSKKKLGTIERITKTTFALKSADAMIEGGKDKGWIHLYETIIELTEENHETMVRLGKVYNKVLRGIAIALRGAVKWFAAFMESIEAVYRVARDNPFITMVASIGAIGIAIAKLTPIMGGFAKLMKRVFMAPFLVLTGIIGAIQELMAVFDPNSIGLFENEKASLEDRKITVAALNKKLGRASPEDMKMLSGLSAERILQAQNNSGGLAGLVGSTSMPDILPAAFNKASYSETELRESQEFLNRMKTSPILFDLARGSSITSMVEDKIMGRGGNVFNQTVVIEGNATPETVPMIKAETKAFWDNHATLHAAPTY